MTETNTTFTPTPPTTEGLYWVWQPVGTWPRTGIVRAVEVELLDGVLCAWVPFMEDADPVSDTEHGGTWENALWSGLIQRPEAPNEKLKGG